MMSPNNGKRFVDNHLNEEKVSNPVDAHSIKNSTIANNISLDIQ